jgi:Flp pilus assembly pilin Flp
MVLLIAVTIAIGLIIILNQLLASLKAILNPLKKIVMLVAFLLMKK